MRIHVVKHLRACTQFQRFCKISNQVKNSYRVYTSTPPSREELTILALEKPVLSAPLLFTPSTSLGQGENVLGQQDEQLEALCETSGLRIGRPGLSPSTAPRYVTPHLLACH